MTEPVHTYPESLGSPELEHSMRLPKDASWSREWALPECPLCQQGICIQRVTQGISWSAPHILHGRIPQ